MKAPDKDLRIYGDRVYLRPITVEDTAMVLSWRNAERTVKNFYYRKPISEKEHKNWIETKVNKGLVHQFVVCLKETDEPVGCVYLQHYDEEKAMMESGVFMSPDAPSGQGIGTEAVKLLVFDYGFKVLNLCKMYAKVISYNEASRRLHIKAGFTEEEYLKNDAEIDGEYVDTVVFTALNK